MKAIRRRFAVALGALCLATACGGDGIDAAKQADIERLLETTNALAIGQQFSAAMVGQYVTSIKTLRPEVSPALLDSLGPVVNHVVSDSLITFKRLVVRIYDKYFTHDEIKALAAFYSTPVGKKTIRVMPSLVQESMATGQKWGEALGPEIDRRVRARLKQGGVEI